MTLAKCDQQVGNHGTKEWLCCWNLITFIEMRDQQALFNWSSYPGDWLTAGVWEMPFSRWLPLLLQVWLWPLQSAGSSPSLGVWDTYLVFPLCAGSFHSSFFNFKCSTLGRLILLYWVSCLYEYMCSHGDNFNWDWEKA